MRPYPSIARCATFRSRLHHAAATLMKRDRKGQWSIRINDQWRVCFRFAHGIATDVEIVDYH